MRLQLIAWTVLTASSCVGQNLLAYPQESTQTLRSSASPLGYQSSRDIGEARYQVLVPARFLPAAGTAIQGIDFYTLPGSGAVLYPSLIMTMSHTTSTSLGTNFAANLPQPSTVLNGSNISISWSNSSWVNQGFTTPFVYDGTSNLVLEIRKTVTKNPGISVLFHGTEERSDLPRVVWTEGTVGSGASTATTSTRSSDQVLKFRLRVSSPSLSLSCGPSLGSSQAFGLGETLTATVYAAAGTAQATLLSDGPATTGVPFPPLAGLMRLNLPTISTRSIGAVTGGSTATTLMIPNSQSLVGLPVVFQAATLGSSLGGPAWTNASDFVIQR